MKIMPLLSAFAPKVSQITAFSAKPKHNTSGKNNISTDTFTKREDKYTKTYKSLMESAYAKQKKGEKTPIKSSDVKFLLDIKDYDKFKTIISTPVEIEDKIGDAEQLNIFFFTDADATRQLAKKLNRNGDKNLFKALLMQKIGYYDENVFHKVAKDDDVKKARALQDNLTKKEFKRFMKSSDSYHNTPYMIALENNGSLKNLVLPIFMEDSFTY